MVDQFIVAGLSKWGQTSRLTLLLPHGYEGNGPEHSSARLERFPPARGAGEHPGDEPDDRGAVLPPRPPAGARPAARPLVVMTPKGLLRLKQASSTLADLAEGSFQPVLDDSRTDKEQVRRLVLCSGKIYYDLAGHELRDRAGHVAIARDRAALSVPGRAEGRARRLVPEAGRGRLGAGGAPEHGAVARDPSPPGGEPARGVTLRYVGRPWRASPSEGLPDRTPARAGTGSSAKHWLREGQRRRLRWYSTARLAIVGPCFRASMRMVLRCRGGMRRQMSHAVKARPIAPVRPVNLRPTPATRDRTGRGGARSD